MTLAALVTGTAAEAYTLQQAARPAEYPPASYRGDVYVDSRGCAYVRANIGTAVNWVPRLSSDRKTVICGLTPTANVAAVTGRPPAPPAPPPPSEVAAAATAAAAPDEAPARAPLAAAPAAAIAAAPEPAAEIRTMTVTCPADGSTARVRIGGGTVGLRCEPGVTAAKSYIIRTANGERTRLIAQPAAPVVAEAARAPMPAATGTGARRVGVGDVLADGRVIIGRAPARATGAAPSSGYAFGNGFGLTSYPGAADPVPVPGSRTTLPVGAAPTAITVTAPVVAPPPAPAIPEGYRAAWDDGRLNPNRGPRSAYGDAQMATVLNTDEVPMRAANPATPRGLIASQGGNVVVSSKATANVAAAPAPAASNGYRYVQVGMFNEPGNATRAVERLQSLGLPGRVARTASGKRVVIAGPYDQTAALNDALATARRAFPDAFLRN
ncbi:SPOR domain-containing protein [Sinisalibacter aestuarii]|uniref:SPOR domain-containing protein n=1 Tax=Sinisalibacter aestuarii TaxID=2949426 RepID=UPI002493268F|nr:SPOR domain-containing protein [Sinisalibacter aestuarii]